MYYLAQSTYEVRDWFDWVADKPFAIVIFLILSYVLLKVVGITAGLGRDQDDLRDVVKDMAKNISEMARSASSAQGALFSYLQHNRSIFERIDTNVQSQSTGILFFAPDDNEWGLRPVAMNATAKRLLQHEIDEMPGGRNYIWRGALNVAQHPLQFEDLPFVRALNGEPALRDQLVGLVGVNQKITWFRMTAGPAFDREANLQFITLFFQDVGPMELALPS